ncbi:NADPH-dependent FMN reductase [Dyadobacter sandarakinus]|uniref:NAD(P)H-dependent oxidoreductase n=1 Tax=Dyadobacter sandarakinus TaxID=2747268 RepID=A0ABX7I728_9BACT|nr:NAD(P)H-dependent oxidoreductase [Dyadobacter sandarakinus]QRR00786.1 NAD(P)H-dependent oxidoreductase [Dyadobacter sandarakinus]
MNLKIITSTTRPGSKGITIAKWVHILALQEKDISVELIDLAEINLPLMDEPNHPRLGQYQHQHTRDWSTTIKEGDAFVIVLAEYNFGFPAPIKNAIDYLFHEWAYKPVAIVSYGGISGGMRSAQMLRQVLTTLQMVPIAQGVTIPFFAKNIDSDNTYIGDESQKESAVKMFSELQKWTSALRPLRR